MGTIQSAISESCYAPPLRSLRSSNSNALSNTRRKKSTQNDQSNDGAGTTTGSGDEKNTETSPIQSVPMLRDELQSAKSELLQIHNQIALLPEEGDETVVAATQLSQSLQQSYDRYNKLVSSMMEMALAMDESNKTLSQTVKRISAENQKLKEHIHHDNTLHTPSPPVSPMSPLFPQISPRSPSSQRSLESMRMPPIYIPTPPSLPPPPSKGHIKNLTNPHSITFDHKALFEGLPDITEIKPQSCSMELNMDQFGSVNGSHVVQSAPAVHSPLVPHRSAPAVRRSYTVTPEMLDRAEKEFQTSPVHSPQRFGQMHKFSTVSPWNETYEQPDGLNVVPRQNRVDDISSIFRNEKTLGTGASAVVLKVRHKKSRVCYALKKMKRSDPGNLESFKHERLILRKALHSNIVRYDSCYIDAEHYCIATEFCSGGTMLSKILKLKRFSEKKAAGYIRSVLSAIKYLHKLNIVHRDLKCNNLVFDKPGLKGVLKVIDFGESIIVDPMKMYDECIGTIHFVPPEVCSTRSGTDLKAGDMWSIGVICYVLCCGEPPFGGENQQEIWEKIQSENTKIPFPSRISASCKEFILGLLCHDIESRMTAEDALQHPWIAGDTAKTTALSSSSYLEMLRQYQKRRNNLHQRMISGILAGIHAVDEEAIHEDLIELNRKKSEMDRDMIAEHLFLYSNVTVSSAEDNDQIDKLDSESFSYKSPSLGVIASPMEIATRRISEHRFRAILSHSTATDHYDPEKAIQRLKDEDGLIPIDEIIKYRSSLDDDDNLKKVQQEHKVDLMPLDERQAT